MSTAPYIEINGRKIGPGQPTYIIAELSANHRQNYETAVELVKAAKAAGADAVKLQTYTPDTITIDCNSKHFMHSDSSLWAGKNLHELYREAYTPWEWQPRLKQLANELNTDLFSSPFDPTSVDFLEQMQVPAYKIASFELVDIPLIETVACTGKPIILSTGMASADEIGEAITAARAAGARQIALLKCNSAYPAPLSGMNLRTIPDMAQRFQIPVGLSDHTLGHEAALIAVSLGACIIEKHFTLNRFDPTADAAFSLEPNEFKQMVQTIRKVESALGEVYYGPIEGEQESLSFRRSLFVVKDIPAGMPLTCYNIRSIRPSAGLPPKTYHQVLGRNAARDLPAGTALQWEDLL